ncbi:MAG: DNA repair protein RecN [Lentisphaeria bacterium]|nr:DNA repair protein RecN [Lentisphaeria bacterium]
MLKWMRVKNLALVAFGEMEFGSSFNVVTGETGAGKSVIMSAVGLLLGARADKTFIRIGEERCEVSGEFFPDSAALEALKDILEEGCISLSEDGSLLVRRIITPSSSRNIINDSPVSLQTLRKIGSLLVDSHSAHESRYLFDPAVQKNMVDRFGHHEEELAAVRSLWDELAAIRRAKEAFAATLPSAEEHFRLKRDAEEISNAAVRSGEDEELEEKHLLASNAKSIIETALYCADSLSECDDSIADRIGQIRRTLSDLEKFDPVHGAKFLSAIEEISALVNDLSSDLSAHADNVEMDEGEFRAMEERLGVLQTMKRRYGPTLEDVLAHYQAISEKIDAYENAEEKRQKFLQKEKETEHLLMEKCAVLTEARKKAASGIADAVTAELKKLGFLRSAFAVELAAASPSADGADKVEFLFSANPGVPPMPLRDVASSGETSRVMLAVKTVLADADNIPILIFDEIDANIGGETAICVGRQIGSLAKKKQILCISHLPQVASFAGTHFMVTKQTDGEKTISNVTKLEGKARNQEIARMLGGGKEALTHASAMLDMNKE